MQYVFNRVHQSIGVFEKREGKTSLQKYGVKFDSSFNSRLFCALFFCAGTWGILNNLAHIFASMSTKHAHSMVFKTFPQNVWKISSNYIQRLCRRKTDHSESTPITQYWPNWKIWQQTKIASPTGKSETNERLTFHSQIFLHENKWKMKYLIDFFNIW